ncbi:hypothetical protein BN10_270009 [Phycicoccus elongatus Lp2]|uniref:Uncharacterized protein n=1 Tax=Phycicoccus elongatus Lp2 TaxID=1193181 RepID=N0E3Z4_9MICO|nr:hypothetical protein BN10_270009 [Phycicoccus elongatus Lp2]
MLVLVAAAALLLERWLFDPG